MERHEALILIIKNLSTIIEGLEQLEEKIKPVFEKMGWSIFEVGVDVTGIALKLTENIKPCDYHLIVYDNTPHRTRITAGVVHAWVKSVVSDYQGYCCVESEARPYSMNPFLSLEFLKDLKKALGGGKRIINTHSGYKHSSVIPNYR